MNQPEKIEPTKLTPAQKGAWGDTMSLMAWTAPGFRHIFYRLLDNNDGEYTAIPSRSIPVAATDGKNIIINPDKFLGMPLKQRVFVAAHEVVHNVFGDVELLERCRQTGRVPMHDGDSLPFDETKLQHAMDYRINALLTDSKIGEMPPEGLYDLSIAGPNDSVLDVYRKVYGDEEDPPKGNNPNKGGFDQVLRPGVSTGQDPTTAAAQRNPQQWAVETAAAQKIEEMRSQGHMPAGMKRMFEELLNPKVPWQDLVHSFLNRRVGSGSYDWRRPDRRFIVRDIHMPSRSGHGAGWIVVWGDTSGSIGHKEMDTNMCELGGILEDLRPRRLTVIWCDAAIHNIDEVEDAADLQMIKSRGVGGGGGTSVDPVFEWIADHTEAPDAFIGFTDGYVSFPPKEPSFPVVWVSTTDAKYPWGEVALV